MANADEKAFQNSLDQDSINQLHGAVLQVSQTCYDIKKLCATVIGSVVAGVVGLAQVQPDVRIEYSFFLIGAAISVFFWFLDGQNYLLQRKMRLRMKELAVINIGSCSKSVEASLNGTPKFKAINE